MDLLIRNPSLLALIMKLDPQTRLEFVVTWRQILALPEFKGPNH